jgi:hypothetical protein
VTRRQCLSIAFASSLTAAPPVRLSRLDGPAEDFDPAATKATALIFLSTICPVSNAYQDRLRALMTATAGKPVRWLLAVANDNESPSDIGAYAADTKLPILIDRYGMMAERFGAVMTPEAVVLDARGEVRYKGAIDDAQNPARVKSRPLRDAVDALVAGREVQVKSLRAFGCAIKRKDSSK